MVADDERREVAERLRANVGKRMPLILNVAFAAFDVDPISLERRVTSDEAALRLADLIDPDCEEGHYEGVHTARPVDREALLALADEMDEKARVHPMAASAPVEIRGYSRRIRKALGVVA